MNPKKFILCADDFGLNPSVCEGILRLARQGRLSAVSCMVNGPYFERYLPDLLQLKEQVAIGLHINFTEGFLLSQPKKACFNLSTLLLRTHLHTLAPSLIEHELVAQLERFIAATQMKPKFIDGHQHVHHLPQIRSQLLRLCLLYMNKEEVTIRSTYPLLATTPYRTKAMIIGYTGGRALRAQLQAHAFTHNDYFTGVYDFSPLVNYRALFNQWLQLAPHNTLIMCHPGEGLTKGDVIAQARQNELNYFTSEQFVEDCARSYTFA